MQKASIANYIILHSWFSNMWGSSLFLKVVKQRRILAMYINIITYMQLYKIIWEA